MKKFFAILLALTMVLSLGVTAFAADITTTDDHTYAVYQIFTGDLSGDVLSNVKWGANAKLPTGANVGDEVPEAVLEELAAVTASTDDQAKLAIIEKYVDLTTNPVDTVTSADKAEVVNGYYLLKDLGISDGKGGYSVPDGQEYSEYVVNIVKNTEITPKKGETTTEKKVDDKNDSTGAEDEIVWKDSADHDIGDAVPFLLSAKITDKYDNYESYYFAFHDKQSAGLTFDPTSVVVKVDGKVITSGFQVVTNPTDGHTFDVVFANLKAIVDKDNNAVVKAGSVITVEYTSTLNTNAIIGALGNPNTMYGEYSNNPNGDGTGKTPEDTVIVFTYETIVNKVDENGDPLEGAGFTLYKFDKATNDYVAIGSEVKGEDLTTFVWKGIDDGQYKLVETTTPAGYNTIKPIEFTVTATHTDGATPSLTSLTATCSDVTFTTGTIVYDEETSSANATVSADVINQSGTVLPETGGIGTTIFYVAGSVLVLAAGILLITKKRMAAKG